MPRYRLRTLLILLAVGPPLLAGAWLTWDHNSALSQQQRIETQRRYLAQLQAQYAAAQAAYAAAQAAYVAAMAERMALQRRIESLERESGRQNTAPEYLLYYPPPPG